MSFANPSVVTINSVDKSMARINMDNYGSEYLLQSDTEEYRMRIRHSKEKAQADGTVFDRHNVELTHTIYADGDTPAIVAQVYAVVRNDVKTSATDLGYLVSGFATFLAAHVSDLKGWQS